MCKTGRRNRKGVKAGLAAKQTRARQVSLTERTGGKADSSSYAGYLAGKKIHTGRRRDRNAS